MRNILSSNKNVDLEVQLGKILFIVLVFGDFVSFSVGSILGLPAIPFGFIAYILTFLLVITYGQVAIFSIKIPAYFWAILFFFVVFFLSTIIRVSTDNQVLFLDIYLVLKYLILFISGILIGTSLLAYPYRKTFSISFITMVFILIFVTDFQNFRINFLTKGEDNYLRLAEWLVLCSIGVVSYSKKAIYANLFFLIALVSLFIINSRFALAGFFVLGLVIIILRFKKKGFILLLSFITIIVVLLVLIIKVDFRVLEDNRVLRLLLTPELDTSLLSRREINLHGLKAISDHWFLGDFRGQVDFSGYGSYIHNILSYWRQYGLISFIGLCGFLILLWIKVIQYTIVFKLKSNRFIFAAGYFTYCTFGALVAKSFVYVELFLSCGIILSILYNKIPESKHI